MWAASPREIGPERPWQRPSEALCFLVSVSTHAAVRRVPRGSLAVCPTHATHARAASCRANVAQEGVCWA